MQLMKWIKKGKQYLTDKDYRFRIHASFGWYNHLSDEEYLRKYFQAQMGKPLNLEEPKTFNEKLQWLKLHDRKPEYTMMVDKYAVKEYVAGIIGEEYIILTLGVWNSFDEIDFNCLPNQFVLKCTHDSGGLVVCRDKSKLDISAAKRKINKALKRNYYYSGREWPYRDITPRIIAEQYIEDSTRSLNDYKFMCFYGEVKCSFVCSERFSDKGLHVTFFDRDWKAMPFERHYPHVEEGLPKPQKYDEMVVLAEKLAVGIPFVRVDFYEVDGKVFFGEITFYPGNGFEEFSPEEWDEVLGSWITLPNS